jgi:hypothetical protein
MAFAGAEFAAKVLRALAGEKGIVAPSFVHLSADAEGGNVIKSEIGQPLDFFSSRVEIGAEGVEKILPLGTISDHEQKLLEVAVGGLKGNIEKVSLNLLGCGVTDVTSNYRESTLSTSPTCDMMRRRWVDSKQPSRMNVYVYKYVFCVYAC